MEEVLEGGAEQSGQRVRRVLRNTGALWCGQVVYMVCMAVWTALVARYVGPGTYGVYVYAQSVVAVLLGVANLGLHQLLIRDVSQQPGLWSLHRRHAFRLTLPLVLLFFGGLGVLTLVRNGTGEYSLIMAIVAINGMITALAAIESSLINAREALHYVTFAQTANSVLTMVSAAVGVWRGWPFTMILFLSLMSTGGYWLILVRSSAGLYGKLGLPIVSVNPPWRETRAFAVRSFPFWTMVLMSSLWSNMGVLFLEWFGAGQDTVGQFGAAQRIFVMVSMLPALLSEALFPTLSRGYAETPDDFPRMFEKAWRAFFVMTVPMAAGVWLTADKVILLFFGAEFLAASDLLRIFGIMLLNGVAFLSGRTMVVIGRERMSAAINWIALIMIAVASLWAIPLFGAKGLCWSMTASSLAGFLAYSALLFLYLHLRFPWVWLGKTLLATTVMFVIAERATSMFDNLFVTIVTAVGAYGLAHILLGTLSEEDRRLVKNVFHRREVTQPASHR